MAAVNPNGNPIDFLPNTAYQSLTLQYSTSNMYLTIANCQLFLYQKLVSNDGGTSSNIHRLIGMSFGSPPSIAKSNELADAAIIVPAVCWLVAAAAAAAAAA